MGWSQDVEARQQVEVERQNALHRGFTGPTPDLWFRATRAQRTRSISILAVSGAALLLACGVIASPRAIYAIAALLTLIAVAGLVSTLYTVRDFTRFSESGIQSRYHGRWREMTWPDVAALDIDEITGRGSVIYLVAVRKDGKRVRLGAPCDDGAVGDPDFDAKLEELLVYCRTQALLSSLSKP